MCVDVSERLQTPLCARAHTRRYALDRTDFQQLETGMLFAFVWEKAEGSNRVF